MGAEHPRQYTAEFRRETADYVLSSGRPINEMARELGINDKTLHHWVKRRRQELDGSAPEAATEADKELKAAKKRIRELEMENEFLKKAAAFFAKDHA